MIRQMQEQDIPRVLEMEQSIFSAPWSEKSFTDAYCAENNIYLVAVQNESIVGYCGLWVSYEMADLCNMAVDPKERQKGIAEQLLREGLQLCRERKVETVLLEVRESNTPAIGLYKKIGFQRIGLRKKYYKEPMEDAILMQLILGNHA